MNASVKLWLIACMAIVVLMVFVGGVTRLTESGLSIVEWKLLSGIMPPLTEQGWVAEFTAYQASPEYQLVNKGMTVQDFKQIFWLEWLHRLLGRIVGMVYLLPLIYFTLRGRISGKLARQMTFAFVLVAAQGAVGWLMVFSGLQQDPRVSPLRLAAHLSLAFTLFSYVLWLYVSHNQFARLPAYNNAAARAIRIITALIALQIIFGAFVAGMDAGLTYNTWPLMDGDFIPPTLLALEPWHQNLYAHIPTVQWQHRSFAYIVAGAVLLFTALQWRRGPRLILAHFAGIVALQFVLGVLTLIYVVPIALASAHQLVALALLAFAVRLCYAYPLLGQKNK